MRDHGPANPTLRYRRSINERLSRLIAIEGRLGVLGAWPAKASGRLDLVGHEL